MDIFGPASREDFAPCQMAPAKELYKYFNEQQKKTGNKAVWNSHLLFWALNIIGDIVKCKNKQEFNKLLENYHKEVEDSFKESEEMRKEWRRTIGIKKVVPLIQLY